MTSRRRPYGGASNTTGNAGNGDAKKKAEEEDPLPPIFDAHDLASGHASYATAVKGLAVREREVEHREATRRAKELKEGGGSRKGRGADPDGYVGSNCVDIVRKLDLLQKLNDAIEGNKGDDGGGFDGADSEGLVDNVFHQVKLEEFFGTTTEVPSFLRAKKNNAKEPTPPRNRSTTEGFEDEEKTEARRINPDTGELEEANDRAFRAETRHQQIQAEESQQRAMKSAASKAGASRGPASNATGSKIKKADEVREIIIPLGAERMEIKDIKKQLRNEYAVRYCEMIKVAPTAANVANIHRHAPIDDCIISQVVHPGLAKGERKNYISIVPACYKPLLMRRAGKVKPCREPWDLDDAALKLDRSVAMRATASSGSTTNARGGGGGGDPNMWETQEMVTQRETQQADAGRGGANNNNGGARAIENTVRFERYKNRFVYPFNLAARFERSGTTRKSQAGDVTSPTTTPVAMSSTQNQRGGGAGNGNSTRGVDFAPLPASRSNTNFNATMTSIASGDSGSSRQASRLEAVRAQLTTGGATGFQEQIDTEAKLHSKKRAELHDALMKKVVSQGHGKSDLTEDELRELNEVLHERPMTVSQAHIQELDALFSDEALQRRENEEQTGGGANATEAPASVGKIRRAKPPTTAQSNAPSVVRVRDEVGAQISSQKDVIAQAEVEALPEGVIAGEVEKIQMQFVKDFPFTSYYKGTDLIRHLKTTVLGDDVTRLAKATVAFLYGAYVVPQTGDGRPLKTAVERDDAFLAMYEHCVTMLQEAQTHKSAVSTELPFIVLCVRVIIEGYFTSRMPTWSTTPRGLSTLQTMDAIFLAAIDPMGLIGHISQVESTPQALRVLHNKRQEQRIPHMLTSPLLHFLIGESQSTAGKAYMRQSHPKTDKGLAELQQHLTPTVRAKLMALFVEKKLGAKMDGV